MSAVFSTLDARDAIVEKIITTWTASEFSDVELYGNNGPKPNLDSLQKVVNYEVVFGDSEQVTIAQRPIDRTWGSIEFHFGVREGKGSKAMLAMQAFMKEELKATNILSVKTLIPSAGKQKPAVGWVFETLYVPFYFDGLPIANTHG